MLCGLLGFQFSPRIRGRKAARSLAFDKSSDYPALKPMSVGRIDSGLVRAHWSEILRVAASIRTATATASPTMRQRATHPRQDGVAAVLRELRRLERTLFTLDWISDRQPRRSTGQELNRDQARSSLARRVLIHRLGETRDRRYQNQEHRAQALSLLVTTVILWTTRYLATLSAPA